MKRALCLSLLLSMIWTSPTPAQTNASGDLAKLQGKWTTFMTLPRGKMRVVIEFKENQVFTTMGDGPTTTPESSQEVVLDETKSPRQITFANGKNLAAKPGSLGSKIGPPDMHSIYELDGDTFTVCTNVGGKTLPTKITTGNGLLVSVYKRGVVDPPADSQPTGRGAPKKAMTKVAAPKGSNGTSQKERDAARAEAEAKAEHKTLKGAKITKAKRGVATVVAADGEEYYIQLPHDTNAFAADGTKVINATHVLQDGNVADLTIMYVGPRPPPWKVLEIHLVSGTTQAPAAAAKKPGKPTAEERHAVVGKVTGDHIVVTIDGEEFQLRPKQTFALSFDTTGRMMPKQSASRLLHEGNEVIVKFREKAENEPYYELELIRLVKGTIR